LTSLLPQKKEVEGAPAGKAEKRKREKKKKKKKRKDTCGLSVLTRPNLSRNTRAKLAADLI
jgi:hypothetical protein